jgi:ferredoxin
MNQGTNDNKNLLKGYLGKFMKSKYFPGIFQWPALLIFAFIIYQTLWGSNSAHDNFGTAMTWVLWWPLIPLLFLLLGRFWCAICPFATVSDFFQKYFGANLPVPKFLKKYGIWIIDIVFIFITWSDHVFGIVESPRGSGYLLMLIFTGVVVAGVFFERRTWCRYLCFLGGLSGNYARSGMVQLRATPEICKNCTTQSCFKGGEKAPGCPMFEFPRTMDTNAKCNFCGHCVKNCPNDSLVLTYRPPTKELWYIRKPKLEEAFLASVIMGIVFVQNITMLEIWQPILDFIQSTTGTANYTINFTIAFIIAMGLPMLALTGAAYLANLATKEGLWKNVARFGYAIIPLDLAGHLAHNLFHLFAEGLAVVYTFLALFGIHIDASPAILDSGTIQVMQYVLVVLGTIGSMYTAYKIAKHTDKHQEDGAEAGVGKDKIVSTFVPYGVLMVVLGVANIILFYLPMNMRM